MTVVYLKKFHIEQNLLTFGLDLDPHSSQSLDPDQHIMNSDPKYSFFCVTDPNPAKNRPDLQH
jgi:hypothetical protein